jgi:exodeoxyribonuclease V alpha subunit
MGNGVFNGDIGTIVDFDSEASILLVLFDDGKKVYYDYPQLEDLELAYCLTVHKSQGSEFDAVIIPVVGGPPKLLTKNLFYTAITRAKKLVVLVGTDYYVQQMITNPYSNNRNTSLSQHLQHYAFMYE